MGQPPKIVTPKDPGSLTGPGTSFCTVGTCKGKQCPGGANVYGCLSTTTHCTIICKERERPGSKEPAKFNLVGKYRFSREDIESGSITIHAVDVPIKELQRLLTEAGL